MFIFQNKKGITFIEVIIIFTIIFIMTAVLLSMSFKDRERKELQAVAREVTASIRETQNYALTGKQTGTGTMPCAFQFVIGSNSYTINHQTRDIDSHECTETWKKFFGEGQNSSTTLSFDVTMWAEMENENTGAFDKINSIEFDVPYGKITADNGAVNNGIAIYLKKDERYYHLCLHTTGMIEDKGISDTADNTKCTF